jgi:enoyl-CoA hydratase/carnithine racemase
MTMIEHDRRGNVVWLRLHHGKANALDVELLNALTDTFPGRLGEL